MTSWNTKLVKRVLARAIVCGMLLILPSCAMTPLRQALPAPAPPETYKGESAPENSSQLRIDEFFNDAMLNGLIDQALVNNRELKILDEEVQIARNEVLGRTGAYLPFLSFGANAGLDRPSLFTPLGAAEDQLEYRPGRHFPDPLGNFQFGLNFLWQLDIFREYRNARDAAAQRYRAATERRNYFVTRMVADVADNYYGLMALDKRFENLVQILELQQQNYKIAKARMDAGRGNELPVRRFLADVRKNQSEQLIVRQDIIEAENRINVFLNRYPQPVERLTARFYEQEFPLSIGVPAQLLLNRPDIRQAELELRAAGLDIMVARAHFFPKVAITSGVGYQAFNPRYLFEPDALAYNLAGNLIAPLLNKKAIQAEYLSANAKQLEAVYNYQRVVINAVTEVVNRISMVQNYSKSVDIKKQQLEALEAAVDFASKLFFNARIEYIDVLTVQRDLQEARFVLIDTKRQQLSAIVNTYQALGGGAGAAPLPPPPAPRVDPFQIYKHWHPFGAYDVNHAMHED